MVSKEKLNFKKAEEESNLTQISPTNESSLLREATQIVIGVISEGGLNQLRRKR